MFDTKVKIQEGTSGTNWSRFFKVEKPHTNMQGSKRFSLNKDDLSKILAGAAVAVGGALLTYVAQTVGEIDFGAYTPIAVALSSVLVNLGRKFLTDYSSNTL